MSEKQSDPSQLPPFNLYNRFAELVLVVGLDEHTGLTPLHKHSIEDEEEEEEFALSNLFFQSYEAQVLAAISASKALVFQPYVVEDPSYPAGPDLANPASLAGFEALRKASKQGNAPNPRQTQAVNAAVIKQHLNKGDSSKIVSDLPLSKDAIESITTFCFPDNAHVYRQKPDSNIHFLVLTDVSGSKTYASCLTFYKPYRLTKDSTGSIHYELVTSQDSMTSREFSFTDNSVYCYIPQCCVLVSKFPYFYAMKECLSCMISHVERDLEEMYQFIKDFTYTMTMAPVPPAGNVIVEMSVYNLSVSLFPSESPEKPVIDLPLHLAFLCFPVDELLTIFTAILCEERLVFVSFNYALLTTIMETFLYYILPMTWRFTYVPILSASSLELLEAPGTFMMGCNSKHLDVVEQVDGLVVANIDEGTVTINSSDDIPDTQSMMLSTGAADRSEFTMCSNPAKPIPNLPEEPAKLFKNICKRAKFQMELSDVQRPFYYDIEAERAFRMKKCLQFNTEISFAFLEMMVNLFRGVLSYLRIDLQRFNKQQFLDSISSRNKLFYEKVLNTDMFKQFLEDRLNEKVDYWTDHEVRTRPYAKRISQDTDVSLGLSHRQQMKPMRKQVSVTTFSSLSPRTFEILRLPALNDTPTYVRHTMAMLNKTIEECRNPQYRPSYIYMRGMFLAAEGNIKAALDDLLSLHGHNVRLLPLDLIRKLLQLLAESEREEILRLSGRHVSELLVLAEQEIDRGGRRYRGIMDNKVVIPDSDLSLEDFVETISHLEMSTDYDTIQRLFLALAQPHRPTHVEKYTFEVLRLSYEENQKQCESLALPEGCLQINEIILRVSNLIKTDFGMGRIVLTDKRLFYIKDVSNQYREIVKLRNITSLEKIQTHWYLISVDVLVINDANHKVKFTAWLKEERNSWAVLIEEMRAGKVVAEATRDFTAIGQAVQNVLLVDAVIKSGQDERSTHHKHVTRAAETLCYFSAYMSEGRHNLPRDTLQALQHRVDPNMGQRERKTVEVLLYTAGGHGQESTTNSPPRLWCGMGDGKVRVFDATNWALEDSFVQTKSTVSALVAVGQGQVWAGSHGIFIIDVDTVSCNKTLTEHADLVTDICLTNLGRHVYSASVDGLIVLWEVQTLRVLRRIRLTGRRSLRRVKVHGDRIWCGTWQSIIVLDLEGVQLQTFSYTDPDIGKQLDLDCFHISNDEIWAGCRRQGQLIVWDLKSTQLKQVIKLDCRGISELLPFADKMWVGTKDGTIYIYAIHSKSLWKTIKAHEDAIRSLCSAEERYIMSGAGSKDGKVAIWSPNMDTGDGEASTKL